MPDALKGLRVNLVALTALALISESPKHPYEIQRCIRDRHHVHAEGKTRALYHSVDRLTRMGLIEPLETSREGKRPERTVYQITPAGREELQAWIVDLLLAPIERPELFAVAIGFVVYLDPELARDTLEQRARDLQVGLAAYDGVRRTLMEMGLPRSVLLDSEHLTVAINAEMGWLRSLVQELDRGTLKWAMNASPIEISPEKRAELEARIVRM